MINCCSMSRQPKLSAAYTGPPILPRMNYQFTARKLRTDLSQNATTCVRRRQLRLSAHGTTINHHTYLHVRRPLTTSVCQCLRSPDVSDHLRTTEEVAPVVRDRNLPVITSRRLEYMPTSKEPKQAWLESLTTVEDEKLGILDLHPDIFATYPRLDILWWNIYWQQTYKKIRYDVAKNRAEMPGGGRKPWPQKGTGRARHGSIRSPLWIGGGKSFGPRGPESYFFMLSYSMRSLGLRVALSCKYSQESLHVVDSLDIPTDDPEYLKDLVESRGWGLSVLFVDDTDIMPQNITLSTDEIKPYNLMPVYGLNVYSILKHETVVLTLRAVEKLEDKLLQQMHTSRRLEPSFKRTDWAANHAQRKGPGLW